MTNNKLLEVKNLNKIFANGKRRIHAVKDVSFDLKNGETIGLIGESGSGKTTIGRTLIRLNDANSGQVLLKGRNVARKKLTKKDGKFLRNNIQMIFQDPYSSLNEQMNIETIVSEPIKTLNLADNYLKEFTEDYDDIIKYYKYDLIEQGFNLRRKTKLNNLNFIKGEYKKLIQKLSTFEITSENKWEELEALVAYYYNLKIEGNFSVTNNNLTLINDLIELFKYKKSKYKRGILKTDLEKKLFKINKEIEETTLLTKHISSYYNKYNKLRILRDYLKEAKDYVNYENENSKSTILNTIESLKSDSSNLGVAARNSKTINEYNLFELESKIKLLISHLLKRDLNILHFKNISNSISKVEKQLFSKIVSRVNKLNKEINIKIENETLIFQIDKNKYTSFDLKNVWIKVVGQNKISDSYFLDNFAGSKSKLLSNEREIVKLIQNKSLESIKKMILKLEDEVKSFSKKIPDKKYAIKLTKLKAEKLILEKESTKVFDEWIVQQRKNESNKKAKFDLDVSKLDEDIQKLKNEAAKLFKSKKELIFNSKIPYFAGTNPKSPVVELNKKYNKKVKKLKEINQKLENESERIKKDIKMIFNVISGKKITKRKLKKYLIREKVFDALEDSGLTKAHAFRYPHEFSGGMRQRVGIARAIISNPNIIIADEPIAALDLSIQAQIANLLKEMQVKKKMSMIFIAHDLAMVKHISDRILIIHLGRIVESGKTEEIFSKPIHPYTKNLISSMPDISRISKGFENNNFTPEYLKNYSPINQPKYHVVGGTHQVLATDDQFLKWKK